MIVLYFILLFLFSDNVDGACYKPDNTEDSCTWCWTYFNNSRGPHSVQDIEYGGCDGHPDPYEPCTKLGFDLPPESNASAVVHYGKCKHTKVIPGRGKNITVEWEGKVCCCGKDMCNKDVNAVDKFPFVTPIQCRRHKENDDSGAHYRSCQKDIDMCFAYFVEQGNGTNEWDFYRSDCSNSSTLDMYDVCQNEYIPDGYCKILRTPTFNHYVQPDKQVNNKTKVCCCGGNRCNDQSHLKQMQQFPVKLSCSVKNSTDDNVTHCEAKDMCFVLYEPQVSDKNKSILLAGCSEGNNDPCTKFNIKHGQCKWEAYEDKYGRICCCDNGDDCNWDLDLFGKTTTTTTTPTTASLTTPTKAPSANLRCYDNFWEVSKCKDMKTKLCFYDCHTGYTPTIQRGCSEGKYDVCDRKGVKNDQCREMICCCNKDLCNLKQLCHNITQIMSTMTSKTSGTTTTTDTQSSYHTTSHNEAMGLMSNLITSILLMITVKFVV